MVVWPAHAPCTHLVSSRWIDLSASTYHCRLVYKSRLKMERRSLKVSFLALGEWAHCILWWLTVPDVKERCSRLAIQCGVRLAELCFCEAGSLVGVEELRLWSIHVVLVEHLAESGLRWCWWSFRGTGSLDWGHHLRWTYWWLTILRVWHRDSVLSFFPLLLMPIVRGYFQEWWHKLTIRSVNQVSMFNR